MAQKYLHPLMKNRIGTVRQTAGFLADDDIGDGILEMVGSTVPLILVYVVCKCTIVETAFIYHASHPEKNDTLCNLLQYCLSPKFKPCLWPWNVYAQHFHLDCVISFLKNWLHVEIIVSGLCGGPTWSFINTERYDIVQFKRSVEARGAMLICSQVYFVFSLICVPRGLWCNINGDIGPRKQG